MTPTASFRDHLAALLGEHERLQQSFNDLSRENGKLQSRLRLAGFTSEPEAVAEGAEAPASPQPRPISPRGASAAARWEEAEPLSPQSLRHARSPTLPQLPVAGQAAELGIPTVELTRAAVPAAAGTTGEHSPNKLVGDWDVRAPESEHRPSATSSSAPSTMVRDELLNIRISNTSSGNSSLFPAGELSYTSTSPSERLRRLKTSDFKRSEHSVLDNFPPEQPPDIWPEYMEPLDIEITSTEVLPPPPIPRGQSMICGEAMVDHRNPLQRLIIRPNSVRRALWDCLSILVLGYDVFYIPLEAFSLEDTDLELGMDTGTTCFWTLDILVTFLTGYHFQGIVEMRPKPIAMRYVKTTFLLDLMVVAVDWILAIFTFQIKAVVRVGKTTRAIRLVRMVRAMRLLRGVNVAKRLSLIFSNIKSDLVRTLCSIIMMLIVLVVFNHYFACGWFAVGKTSENGWIQASSIQSCEPIYCYMTSLHWSLTQFTPASMEVHATNLQERTYSVAVLLFAMVTFSSFVSSITSGMMYLRKLKTEPAQQEAILRQFFQENKISAELGQRIWLFLQNNHFQNRKRVHRHDLAILKLVPESLMNTLSEELYLPVLSQNPFFRNFSNSQLSVVNEVCRRCIGEKFLLGREELFSENKVAENMSFVTMGTMDYKHRQAHLSAQVRAGQWACEPVLWMMWRHCGRLRARTSCEIVQLNAAKFRAAACREQLSQSYASSYARTFREYLTAVTWYTDIWSDVQELEEILHICADMDLSSLDPAAAAPSTPREESIPAGAAKTPFVRRLWDIAAKWIPQKRNEAV